ncbi:MAG: RNA polymerase sigma factor [Bacteroidota bacterium]
MKPLENPFGHSNYSDQKDLELLSLALAGDKKGLTQLIERHQKYIFNIALKMINNVEDAKDVTQEVLLKLITHLGKYDASKGKFRTWLYRITFNHILNIKKQKYEQLVTGFDSFFDAIENAPTHELSDEEEKDMQQFIEESKVACMAGMLMCLSRAQRLIYIVGEVFEIDHKLASEIFEITPANFRQKLSRARKDLYQWMNNRCGLVNKENPCRCKKKTKGFIENGWVNPDKLTWNSDYHQSILEVTNSKIESTLLTVDDIYAKLYKEHPFKIDKTKKNIVEEIINNQELKAVFRLSE